MTRIEATYLTALAQAEVSHVSPESVNIGISVHQ
jgi:hypothetical protein